MIMGDKVKILSEYTDSENPIDIVYHYDLHRDTYKTLNTKDNYCKIHNIPLYRMEVPFYGFNKWDYADYCRYINTELKDIVNLSRGGSLC